MAEPSKPRQDRYRGRASKVRSITLTDPYWGRLRKIAATRPGLGTASAAVRYLIDKELPDKEPDTIP